MPAFLTGTWDPTPQVPWDLMGLLKLSRLTRWSPGLNSFHLPILSPPVLSRLIPWELIPICMLSLTASSDWRPAMLTHRPQPACS